MDLLTKNDHADLRMGMHLRNARYSAYHADPGVGRTGLRVAACRPLVRRSDGDLRDQVAAHIEGGAARLTEARLSIVWCETKPDREACTAGRRQPAPDTRPARTTEITFPLVSAIPGNGLRSRERRFESCRGHWSEQ